jgi:broad specificity phosphatase PhoE
LLEAILARHAESEFSVRGLVNGDAARPGALTKRGREQARRLAGLIARDPVELCVVTEFGRTQETAALALEARGVPRLVMPELNDIRFGRFEGRTLEEYRGWAAVAPPEVAVRGGESRADAVARFVRGFRLVLARPEATVLVVTHGLPIRYVLDAVGGRTPTPRVEQVALAEPFRLDAAELEGAIEVLERWAQAPVW